MTTIHELLDQYESMARDTREKGFLFERLIAQFLRTDPVYADRCDAVWLWSDWPGRDGKVDTGIDLVARERATGELCAIQCKFYAPTHVLQKADIGITLSGIPNEAYEYMLGPRSALEWVMRQYQVTVDKASGIVNDPNDWATEHDEPDYILNLVRRAVTVSVETVRIVKSLPPLRTAEEQ
ncbi:type ISP restriction/modification enzyme [Rathayibacter sp. KR2-224]|uniref:restriction endonuclease n=1 Tax=Rathayibacter sp. KR2-224 TaxID=3400913 RepID=UPI003BFE2B2C